MRITIPPRDPFFKDVNEIPFHRSKPSNPSSNGVRQYENLLTAWLDLGQVYGSSEAKQNHLRDFRSRGKLKTSGNNLLTRK